MTDSPLALTATGIGRIAGLGPDAYAQVSDLGIGLLIVPVLVPRAASALQTRFPADLRGNPSWQRTLYGVS